MTILIECKPREGTHCEKSILISEKVKKIEKGREEYAISPGFLFSPWIFSRLSTIVRFYEEIYRIKAEIKNSSAPF